MVQWSPLGFCSPKKCQNFHVLLLNWFRHLEKNAALFPCVVLIIQYTIFFYDRLSQPYTLIIKKFWLKPCQPPSEFLIGKIKMKSFLVIMQLQCTLSIKVLLGNLLLRMCSGYCSGFQLFIILCLLSYTSQQSSVLLHMLFHNSPVTNQSGISTDFLSRRFSGP